MKSQIVYRLQTAAYSKPEQILSGEGARLFGGRWNPIGTPLIYTSLTAELATLEYLVHYFGQKSIVDLHNLVLAIIEIPADSILPIELGDLPKDWNQTPAPSHLQSFTKQLLESKNYLTIKIPTVVNPIPTPFSYNLLINPQHPRINEVKVLAIQPFTFDSRIVPPKDSNESLIESLFE